MKKFFISKNKFEISDYYDFGFYKCEGFLLEVEGETISQFGKNGIFGSLRESTLINKDSILSKEKVDELFDSFDEAQKKKRSTSICHTVSRWCKVDYDYEVAYVYKGNGCFVCSVELEEQNDSNFKVSSIDKIGLNTYIENIENRIARGRYKKD